jgi:hypothetical protein
MGLAAPTSTSSVTIGLAALLWPEFIDYHVFRSAAANRADAFVVRYHGNRNLLLGGFLRSKASRVKRI